MWERRAYARQLIKQTVEANGAIYIICGEERRIITTNPKILRIAESLGVVGEEES